MDLVVVRERLDSPIALSLITALNAELAEAYPEPGANHFRLDLDEVAPGRGAFFVAYADDVAAGCGAIRKNDEDVAEVKRMYVAPGQRGRGVGRAVLDALEAEARRLGVSRIVLETGPKQVEAIALYERAGFVRIPLFGEYLASPKSSYCMGKDLESDRLVPLEAP